MCSEQLVTCLLDDSATCCFIRGRGVTLYNSLTFENCIFNPYTITSLYNPLNF
ncbi:hypothetical protein HanRHA438_Chr17g0806491 [Helianthus annuus]|uniref:Uncharacterized protein n=1 Tax=Helianthus annuus TaxID=4232 RepID=A0A9K3DG17_HELAN|nr:hypothetical protein HanXRQr2_Chr17g0796461 [Helianthus annuus]KAJ0447046.1 hypothetical protein HanHA89_Chr17g0700981 [Helianthus annuus]KAJ0631949.1 hypothetical protein HanLR1_Chr17g0659631 [Helianthus annuus]KAJ0825737.1 hypothetical protein HanRHA438_Chr17g0806491 [Helianthus annuus]